VSEETPYRQTIAAGRAAIAILNDGVAAGKLHFSRKEQQWLTRIEAAMDELPASEASLVAALDQQYGHLYDKASYGM
jgi:hypothetical protein